MAMNLLLGFRCGYETIVRLLNMAMKLLLGFKCEIAHCCGENKNIFYVGTFSMISMISNVKLFL